MMERDRRLTGSLRGQSVIFFLDEATRDIYLINDNYVYYSLNPLHQQHLPQTGKSTSIVFLCQSQDN